MSRPKGSKNKPKENKEVKPEVSKEEAVKQAFEETQTIEPTA